MIGLGCPSSVVQMFPKMEWPSANRVVNGVLHHQRHQGLKPTGPRIQPRFAMAQRLAGWQIGLAITVSGNAITACS